MRIQGQQFIKGTVSQDFRPFLLVKKNLYILGPHRNRQKRFGETFRFREDIREDVPKKRVFLTSPTWYPSSLRLSGHVNVELCNRISSRKRKVRETNYSLFRRGPGTVECLKQ